MSSPMSLNTPDNDDLGNQAFLESSGLTNETIRHDYNDSPLLPDLSLDITAPTLFATANVMLSGSKEEMQNYLYQRFQKFIQDFFKEDDHQYPYTQTIQWSIGQDPKTEYHLTITIRQPTHVASV